MFKPGFFARQTSSFPEPVEPPSSEPDAAPLVCLSFGRDWLPYVLGGLTQLAQPTTWSGDATAVQTALDRVQLLMSIFGTAEECEMTSFRFTDACVLQYSTDGGTTWTDTPGWDTFAPGCFTGATGATGATGSTGPAGPAFIGQGDAPPNPQGATTAQQGCNIAAYLAASIVKASLQSFVDSKNGALSQVDAVAATIALLTGFDPIVDLIVGAAAIGANYVYAQTTSDYTDALADPVFLSDVQCAIYEAILVDGYATAGNFAAILTNLAAISYAHADVVTTVHDYVSALGVTGLQMMQVMGSLYVGDCSACGTWCYTWDFTAAAMASWSSYNTGTTNWVPTSGYVGSYYAPGNLTETGVYLNLPSAQFIADFDVTFVATVAAAGTERDIFWYNGGVQVGITATSQAGSGTPVVQGVTVGATIDQVLVILRNPGSSTPPVISRLTMRGTGTNPYGTDNC